MNKLRKKANFRRKRKSSAMPIEIIGRLQSLHEHSTLREQKDTFTTIIKHPSGNYRWCNHLIKLPYYHIIDTEKNGNLIRLHVYRYQFGDVLSLEFKNKQWSRLAVTPDDQLQGIIPNRHRRTGWLAKQATRNQRGAVASTVGMRFNELPGITAANANVIIHTHELLAQIDSAQIEIERWLCELRQTEPQAV